MENKLISVEQARKKLGERGKKMTDQQVQKLLDLLYSVANKAIDYAVK